MTSTRNTLGQDRPSEVRMAVALFALTMYGLVLEGAVRKWVVDGRGVALLFINEASVVFLILRARRIGAIRVQGRLVQTWTAFAAVSVMTSAWAYMGKPRALEGVYLGFRSYWIYLPLVVVLTSLSLGHARLVKQGIYDAIGRLIYPTSALMILQVISSPSSIWNKGISQATLLAGSVDSGVVRASGWSTSPLFAAMFSLLLLHVALEGVLSGGKGHSRWFPVSAAVCCVVCSGSRQALGVAVVQVFTWVLASAERRHSSVLAAVALVAAVALLLPQSLIEAWRARLELTGGLEGGLGRAGWQFFDSQGALLDAPILGHGLGAGSPGYVGLAGLPPWWLGEPFLPRAIRELGLLAPFFYGLCAAVIVRAWLTRAFPEMILAAVMVGTGWATSSALSWIWWVLVSLICIQMQSSGGRGGRK